jgi:hypothetical protein
MARIDGAMPSVGRDAELVALAAARRRHLVRLAALAGGALQDLAQLVGVKGLGDVVGGAGAHRLDHRLRLVERRAHDHRRLAAAGAVAAQGLDPVELGHDHVDHDQVGARRLRQPGQRRLAAVGGLGGVAERLDERAQIFDVAGVVVDDEDGEGVGHVGLRLGEPR